MCPDIRWPPISVLGVIDLSKLSMLPFLRPLRLVLDSVSSTTSNDSPFLPLFKDVKQMPLTEILAPFCKPLQNPYGGSTLSVIKSLLDFRLIIFPVPATMPENIYAPQTSLYSFSSSR